MWGNKGWSAVESELSQTHNRDVLEPQDPNELTQEEKRNSLESHLFLEEKKNKEIKGRIVGGGNKQRSYTPKQEASSPTSHIESIFCTSVIDSEEGRDVAVADIPNAFVQTNLIKDGEAVKIIMVIRGRLADIN